MEYNLRTVTKSYGKYRHLRFPLKIWILVNASGNRFLYWDSTETVVVVDRDATEQYLKSSGSIFCCHKLATFFWLMDFNGFELVSEYGDDEDEDKHILLYKHSSFTRENRAYFEQLLRSQKAREVINQQNGNCSVHRAKIPKSVKQCEADGTSGSQSRLSSSSFAQEKFSLLMEMKSLDVSIREAYASLPKGEDDDEVIPVIEVPDTYSDKPATSVPEYTEQRIIAGNYGRGNPNDLKRFFGNYLPVYEDSPGMTLHSSKGVSLFLNQRFHFPEMVDAAPSEEKVAQASEPTEVATDEPLEEVVTVSPETSKTEPANTLATFDYQDDDGMMDLENFKPTIGDDMPFLGAGATDEEELAQVKHDTKCNTEPTEEAQFQLYSDIRETFDLLNEF
ncbi:uncharacterized protein LOC135713783 [Ochlerotatus camptorhynchus]|uniref:uncharacterized protein LOC135713783 n=1 Tax=Ochlerotatus camptorhynchus TaxID=644619 RepID=UPI0031D5C1AE